MTLPSTKHQVLEFTFDFDFIELISHLFFIENNIFIDYASWWWSQIWFVTLYTTMIANE